MMWHQSNPTKLSSSQGRCGLQVSQLSGTWNSKECERCTTAKRGPDQAVHRRRAGANATKCSRCDSVLSDDSSKEGGSGSPVCSVQWPSRQTCWGATTRIVVQKASKCERGTGGEGGNAPCATGGDSCALLAAGIQRLEKRVS